MRRSALLILSLAGAVHVAAGCASSGSTPAEAQASFLARVEVQEQGGLRVSAAVPSAEETRALFGAPLYRRGVQPVWLEISNGEEQPVSFLSVGVDDEYFTPIEAANIDVDFTQSAADERRSRFFVQQALPMRVQPGETRSGFVFTSIDEGTKSFNVDIVGANDSAHFTFFVQVPGLKIDHYGIDWKNLYPADQVVDAEESELIDTLEKAPCCTTNEGAKDSGDPLNLVVIGDLDDIYYAFIRAGWDETETIHRGSLWKTVASFMSGGEYRYSPVSGLFVFGRPQDVAFQKARDNIHERNHLRLWMTSVRYRGKPVFIGQISRDIGVRFTRRTITTHKIDPDVDETREFLLENLAYAQAVSGFGYVEGVGAASMDEPRGNLTGDPYFTDGHRLVLMVTSGHVDLADIEVLGWRNPPDRESR